MHRFQTKHSSGAFRSSRNHAASMQMSQCNSTATKSSPTPVNLDEQMGDLIKREIGISNVHHLITQNSKKPKISSNSKKSSTIIAPETALTPPSTPSSPVENVPNENFEILIECWTKFATNDNGEPDNSIVMYEVDDDKLAKKSDFKPFNIDRFLAEKLLTELDIDTKYAQF